MSIYKLISIELGTPSMASILDFAFKYNRFKMISYKKLLSPKGLIKLKKIISRKQHKLR